MELVSDRQTFCDLVDCLEIGALESRCPVSVPPFLRKEREYSVCQLSVGKQNVFCFTNCCYDILKLYSHPFQFVPCLDPIK